MQYTSSVGDYIFICIAFLQNLLLRSHSADSALPDPGNHLKKRQTSMMHIFRCTSFTVANNVHLLQVGAEFLSQHYPNKQLYLPAPTWANHGAIFGEAGLETRPYRYYHSGTKGLDFQVSPSLCSKYRWCPRPWTSPARRVLQSRNTSICQFLGFVTKNSLCISPAGLSARSQGSSTRGNRPIACMCT